MRLSMFILLGLLALIMTGCGHTNLCVIDRQPADPPAMTRPDADLASALLFDRRPGRYHASDFAFRSDWPATDSFYSPGQVIYFSERFVDHQGRNFGESDYTYRRFQTVRVGVGYR